MKDPTLAPVKRYNWRANRMITLSSPGIKALWSVCHKDETILKKSSFVKLYFCFLISAIVPSAVKVLFIHYITSQKGFDIVMGK